MKIVGMIDPQERIKKKCFFCGTRKSVKYIVEFQDKFDLTFHVYCCNKCCILQQTSIKKLQKANEL
jgi:hypothetical protein